MQTIKLMLITFTVALLVLWSEGARGESKVEQDFLNPPDSAKPACFWMWLNCNVDKERITHDLEEIKAKGIGGVMICSSSGGGAKGPDYLSPQWRELYKFSLMEASRYGLEVGVNLCGGWDMGGPWITPEHAGRWYLQSETNVVGPQRFSGVLPLPGPKDGYDSPPRLQMKDALKRPFDQIDYRDAVVLAFRESSGGARLRGKRLDNLPAKSNREDAGCFAQARPVMEKTLTVWENQPSDNPIKPAEVIDLTSKLGSGGKLEWEVPEGSWTILRIGHRVIGAKVAVPVKGSEGLEVDWLSKAAVDLHWDHLIKVLLADAGPLVGNTLKYFFTDSFEDGYPNWTPKFLEEFKRYRGYDAMPYLPVLMGRIVGSAEISDRFLHDYRKTVADCMADNNYGYLGQRVREHGMEIQCEAGGPSWSGTVCMDALKNLGRCERPMGEFWTDLFTQNVGTPKAPIFQNKVCKQTSGAAHVYGRRTASAEAFTSFLPHWSESPAFLKSKADRAFCEGINRLVLETVTATQPKDGLPGNEFLAGTHFNPNVTWWNQAAGPWIGYINRCQALLQSGLFVADVLYYNGDWAPNLVEPKHVDPLLGKGYDYDVCNAEVLLTRLSVKDGKIVLPDGMSYRLLVLPNTKRMPIEVIQKIKQLVQAGATVVGPKPESDPGLRDYPNCDAAVKAIAAELWGDLDGKQKTERTCGQGRVVWGKSMRDVLTADGVSPDFTHTGEDAFIDFIHRTDDGVEVYFLANRNDRAESVDCRFRVSGRQPEWWNPITGERRDLPVFEQKEGCTRVPLQFEPHGSAFLVFRKPAAPSTGGKNFAELKPLVEVTGAWTVQFDPRWFYPTAGLQGDAVKGLVAFAKLEDWSQRPEPAVKYFSGTAVYRNAFTLAAAGGPRLYLDLGGVANGTARVRLNGQDVGVAWSAPWRVEITSQAKAGANQLEVEVVNLWPNRLIGDANLPAGQGRTRSNIRYKKDAALLPSGLLGPVRVMAAEWPRASTCSGNARSLCRDR